MNFESLNANQIATIRAGLRLINAYHNRPGIEWRPDDIQRKEFEECAASVCSEEEILKLLCQIDIPACATCAEICYCGSSSSQHDEFCTRSSPPSYHAVMLSRFSLGTGRDELDSLWQTKDLALRYLQEIQDVDPLERQARWLDEEHTYIIHPHPKARPLPQLRPENDPAPNAGGRVSLP